MGIITFIRELIDPHWSTFAITAFVQFILFLRWLYRRMRNDEMTRMFVEDMATCHLPHIYELLEKICDEKGIERAGTADPLGGFEWSPAAEIIALAATALTRGPRQRHWIRRWSAPWSEQESAWDPHAIRYEPGFRSRYVAPLQLPPIGGNCPFDFLGIDAGDGASGARTRIQRKFLSALCDPAAGLKLVAALLAAKLAGAAGDVSRGLALWNGGGKSRIRRAGARTRSALQITRLTQRLGANGLEPYGFSRVVDIFSALSLAARPCVCGPRATCTNFGDLR